MLSICNVSLLIFAKKTAVWLLKFKVSVGSLSVQLKIINQNETETIQHTRAKLEKMRKPI